MKCGEGFRLQNIYQSNRSVKMVGIPPPDQKKTLRGSPPILLHWHPIVSVEVGVVDGVLVSVSSRAQRDNGINQTLSVPLSAKLPLDRPA